MMMSKPSQPNGLLPMELPLTQYAEGSPARTHQLHRQARGSASMAHEPDSGASIGALLANYDHESQSWRTLQGCLVQGLEEFSEAWPRSGMMRSGAAYLHRSPAYRIEGTGSGSLPTPAARDFRDISKGEAFLSQRKRHSPSMATQLLERGVHWTAISTAYEIAMGFPFQWTVSGSKPSETPSSRRSRKRSGEQSSE